MLCTMIGAIILSINIQVGLNMPHIMTSGMHRRPFEGRYLVASSFQFTIAYDMLNYVKLTALSITTISRTLTPLVLQISAV